MTLGDELDAVRKYLAIQELRFGSGCRCARGGAGGGRRPVAPPAAAAAGVRTPSATASGQRWRRLARALGRPPRRRAGDRLRNSARGGPARRARLRSILRMRAAASACPTRERGWTSSTAATTPCARGVSPTASSWSWSFPGSSPRRPLLADRIRAVVVDDEPLARRSLRLLLAADPDVELVGECDALEAVEVIGRERPDLLFLDVQMPELDGFGLLARVGVETCRRSSSSPPTTGTRCAPSTSTPSTTCSSPSTTSASRSPCGG